MMLGLLWVIGIYALCAAVAHFFCRKRFRQYDQLHVILICHNNERQMEWVLRSIFAYAELSGKNLGITLVDLGSTDNTLRIAQTMLKRRMEEDHWKTLSWEDIDSQIEKAASDKTVRVIRLDEIEDWRNIPLTP